MKQEREGTLIVLACHGVYATKPGQFHGEHPADRPVYDSQLTYAVNHLVWREASKPLLVISGGPTKAERKCSESRSYLQRARELGLQVTERTVLEQYALTSVENLLLSIYLYHQSTGTYPKNIEVISWEFKRRRFKKTLEAINAWGEIGLPWPDLEFFPVGDLWGIPRERALQAEEQDCDALDRGLGEYYQLPRVQQLVQERDVHDSRDLARKAYEGYALLF